MRKALLNFLSKNTTLSSMRLGSFIMIISACLYVISYYIANLAITLLNVYFVHHYAKHTIIQLLVIDWYGAASFAVAGLLGKAGQAYSENKFNNSQITNSEKNNNEKQPITQEIG